MKRRARLIVHLNPHAAVRSGEIEPKLVDERVFELKAAGMGSVPRVNNSSNDVRVAPGAKPKRLALPFALAAPPKDPERLFDAGPGDANAHLSPPRTALGRSRSLSWGRIPAS